MIPLPGNPFRTKTRYERVRAEAERRRREAEKARKDARKEADRARTEARKEAGKARKRAEEAAEPVPERARGPLLVVGVLAIGALIVLVVRKALASGEGAPTSGQEAPRGESADGQDPALKSKVESELNADENVPAERVKVAAGDGVVTLRGRLRSVEEATAAAATTEKVNGVSRVENLLTFEPA